MSAFPDRLALLAVCALLLSAPAAAQQARSRSLDRDEARVAALTSGTLEQKVSALASIEQVDRASNSRLLVVLLGELHREVNTHVDRRRRGGPSVLPLYSYAPDGPPSPGLYLQQLVQVLLGAHEPAAIADILRLEFKTPDLSGFSFPADLVDDAAYTSTVDAVVNAFGEEAFDHLVSAFNRADPPGSSDRYKSFLLDGITGLVEANDTPVKARVRTAAAICSRALRGGYSWRVSRSAVRLASELGDEEMFATVAAIAASPERIAVLARGDERGRAEITRVATQAAAHRVIIN